jgi:hypothetical protein
MRSEDTLNERHVAFGHAPPRHLVLEINAPTNVGEQKRFQLSHGSSRELLGASRELPDIAVPSLHLSSRRATRNSRLNKRKPPEQGSTRERNPCVLG